MGLPICFRFRVYLTNYPSTELSLDSIFLLVLLTYKQLTLQVFKRNSTWVLLSTCLPISLLSELPVCLHPSNSLSSSPFTPCSALNSHKWTMSASTNAPPPSRGSTSCTWRASSRSTQPPTSPQHRGFSLTMYVLNTKSITPSTLTVVIIVYCPIDEYARNSYSKDFSPLICIYILLFASFRFKRVFINYVYRLKVAGGYYWMNHCIINDDDSLGNTSKSMTLIVMTSVAY